LIRQEGHAFLADQWDRLDAAYQHSIAAQQQVIAVLETEYQSFLAMREASGF